MLGELRLQSPMVDPRLFGNTSFSGAAIVAFAFSVGLPPMYFYLTLYLQNYLGFSPLQAGLCFLPLSGLVLIISPLAGVLSHRLGHKLLMTVGMALGVASLLLMATLTPRDTQTDWVRLLPGLAFGGVASGLASPAISNVAVSAVARSLAGLASGVSSVCRQIGTAFGIAFLGAILTSHYDAALQTGISRLAVPDAANRSGLTP